MNPDLARLQPYPFERLRQLLAGNTPPAGLAPINLSIGEPKHATPKLLFDALTAALPTLASYPSTLGTDALRESIAAWLARRHGLPKIDPATQVMPVAGSREALFAFAQTVVDRSRGARVVIPNPFYQIYEGAALLAGAQPLFLPCTPDNGFRMDFAAPDAATWSKVQLVYVCSPGNPHGRVMTLPEWRTLFELADRHDFVIASDECYSEIYFDEDSPPLGERRLWVAAVSSDWSHSEAYRSARMHLACAPVSSPGTPRCSGASSSTVLIMARRSVRRCRRPVSLPGVTRRMWSKTGASTRRSSVTPRRSCSRCSTPRCRTPPFISGHARRLTTPSSRAGCTRGST